MKIRLTIVVAVLLVGCSALHPLANSVVKPTRSVLAKVDIPHVASHQATSSPFGAATSGGGGSFQKPIAQEKQASVVVRQHDSIGNSTTIGADTLDHIIYFGSSHSKQIALTFDDGPDGVFTPQILQVLQKDHAKATFFLVGQLAAYHPDVVKQIVANGDEIGNHSWDHADLAKLSLQAQVENVEHCEAELAKLAGYRPLFFRPPYGDLGAPLTDLIVRGDGMDIAYWSVDTDDWKDNDKNFILNRLHRSVHTGSVVLLHSAGGLTRRGTVEAIASYIPQMQHEGYTFVTLSELFGVRTAARDASNSASIGGPAQSAASVATSGGGTKG